MTLLTPGKGYSITMPKRQLQSSRYSHSGGEKRVNKNNYLIKKKPSLGVSYRLNKDGQSGNEKEEMNKRKNFMIKK